MIKKYTLKFKSVTLLTKPPKHESNLLLIKAMLTWL